MIDMATAAAVALAETHYRRNEWSGCAGSTWGKLPQPVQDRLVAEAQEWIDSLRAAHYDVEPHSYRVDPPGYPD